MPYTMKIYVDGGCRRNGSRNATGGAAAVRTTLSDVYWSRTESLYARDNPTNQRAEITAIILGLRMALEAYEELDSCPQLNLTIFSDSRYAVDCMNEWIYKWSDNGWINSRGDDVANKDLIQRASNLDDDVKELGSVKYVWIPRSENELADKHCNEAMDNIEEMES